MGWGVHDYPEPPPEPPRPTCPVCGQECDTYYRGADGAIIGCDVCIDALDAWDYYYEMEGL